MREKKERKRKKSSSWIKRSMPKTQGVQETHSS